MSKLGVHEIAYGGGSRWTEAMLAAGAPIAKVVDDPQRARMLARRWPGRIIIERRAVAEHGNALSAIMQLGTPSQAAAEWVRRYHVPSAGVELTYVEGPNEPVIDSLHEMRWYAMFEAERARIMSTLGFGTVVGNLATGNPADLTLWREAAAMVDACQRVPRTLFGVHEYGDHRVPPAADTWNLLRYRRMFSIFAANRYPLPHVVITECGLDRVNSGQPGGGRPWRVAGISERELASYMDAYDAELERDPHVLGAVEFTAGGQLPDNWRAEFGLEDANEYMRHRLAKTQREAGATTKPNEHAMTTYTVQRGDTLSAIAARHGTTVSALLGLNPEITNPNVIRVGQVLRVRASATRPPDDPTPQPASKLIYVSRDEWRPRTDLPRLGAIVNADRRDRVIMHHTVGLDRSDDTPNAWPSMARVMAAMRGLQTIRPDLGFDVPYNYVMFILENGELVVCEGRGAHRSGAHTGTSDWNVKAIGIALHGNAELPLPPTIDSNLAALSGWLASLRARELPRLGDRQPGNGRQVYGHRDVYATACPGRHLYAKLGAVTVIT